MSIQQMLLGVGAVATKTYVDDIFSTFVYAGTGANRSINNGIDMSSSGGGLTWIKKRTGSESHYLFDTERGSGKYLQSNGTNAEGTNNDYLSAFNNNGFSLGDYNDVNGSGQDYASWTFRKASGFFDVVTYTGNSTAGRQVSHNLGSIPGLMIVKCTSSAGEPWYVYHKDLGATKHLKLDTTSASSTSSEPWNNTEPTSTHFTLAQYNSSNGSGKTYVAYLFAGGESTAATARSVDFDGTGDVLTISDAGSSDGLRLGSSDFTVECWLKSTQTTSSYATAVGKWTWSSGSGNCWMIRATSQDIGTGWSFFYSTNGSNYSTVFGSNVNDGQWHHVAVTRSGNTIRTFTDGLLNNSTTVSGGFHDSGADGTIGANSTSTYYDGQISNVRVVKGTAVYTSSFKPPTEPLTNITNTVLLCCNNSSITGSSVTTGTIGSGGDPTASTDSPFDDPAAHVFGESGSESVIKCGSYMGNANNDGPEINLGWEPSFILLKPAESAENWGMWDSMRGIVTGGNDMRFLPNGNHAEITNFDGLSLTPTGFKITSLNALINPSGEKVVYIAIRRPDGYVGKPVELGTGVFAMDGSGAGTPGPSFISNFPVDFGLTKKPAASQNWYTGLRLLGSKYLATNTSGDANTDAEMAWDYNNGFVDGNFFGNSANQGWMWKRHAGFDVVTYSGNGVTGRQIPHSMGVAPEMMWVKRTNANENWYVYHKGHNGGSGPEHWFTSINTTGVEQDHGPAWNDTVPTSTHFTLGADTAVNSGGTTRYIACLFASTDVSKVGYYTGTGSATTITTGFQPRFLLIKNVSSAVGWYLLDTTRGWGSGNDEYLTLNDAVAQDDFDFGAPTSTGFTLASGDSGYNGSNQKYIYYAHA